jgi:hypothetical protein
MLRQTAAQTTIENRIILAPMPIVCSPFRDDLRTKDNWSVMRSA